MKNYTELIGKYEGKTAIICGAGPSLYEVYMNKKVWEKINNGNQVIIICNSAILAFDWYLDAGNPDMKIWLSNDSLSKKWSWWELVKKANCIKIVRNSWLKYKKELKGFLFFSPRKTSEDIVDFEEQNLCYCSSLPSSLDLSLQLGCKSIFLLGADHSRSKDGKRYFWEYFNKKDQPRQIQPAIPRFEVQARSFKFNNMAYKALKKFAEYKKVNIYNCNPESKVEVFDKITIKELLKIWE